MTARMTNGHWLIGQIGLRKSFKDESRTMLLEPRELPDQGWKIRNERSWRAGMRMAHTDEGQRARRAGSVTTWRSYENESVQRWMWIQVAPLVSEQDAASYVPKVRDQLVANPRAKRIHVENRMIEKPDVPGLALTTASESVSTEPRGLGHGWIVIGHIDRVVLMMSCSYYDDAWSWAGAKSTIALQVAKIHRRVEPATAES